jgi:hypothetical protein
MAARAVVAIWTPTSVKSDWVRAEAGRAKAEGKLIPVKAAGVDYADIPLPFGEMHTENVGATDLGRGRGATREAGRRTIRRVGGDQDRAASGAHLGRDRWRIRGDLLEPAGPIHDGGLGPLGRDPLARGRNASGTQRCHGSASTSIRRWYPPSRSPRSWPCW